MMICANWCCTELANRCSCHPKPLKLLVKRQSGRGLVPITGPVLLALPRQPSCVSILPAGSRRYFGGFMARKSKVRVQEIPIAHPNGRNLAFIATPMDSGVEFVAVDNPHISERNVLAAPIGGENNNNGMNIHSRSRSDPEHRKNKSHFSEQATHSTIIMCRPCASAAATRRRTNG